LALNCSLTLARQSDRPDPSLGKKQKRLVQDDIECLDVEFLDDIVVFINSYKAPQEA